MQQTNDRIRRRRRLVLPAVLMIAGVLAALYLVASGIVLNMAISPRRGLTENSPITDGVPAEAVSFSSSVEPITLQGYLLPGNGQRAVVLLHGLDSASWRGFHRDLAKAYQEHGYTVLLFDMRGHGRSGGDELGLGWRERDDVRAAVDLLMDRGFEPGAIGIHGSSYGGATALLSAAYIPEIGAVVSDSAFADFRELLVAEIDRRVGAGALFSPGILLNLKWRVGLDPDEIKPLAAVPRIAPRPILFIHGEDDMRIPVSHTQRLAAASSNPDDEVWIVPGAGHTGAFNLRREMFLKKVFSFFDRHLGR